MSTPPTFAVYSKTALAYRADFKQRMKELRLEEEKTGGEKEERDISVAIEPDKNY